MGKKRDPDAAACYVAEDSVKALTYKTWYSVEQAQEWVDKLLRSAWACALWPLKCLRRIVVKVNKRLRNYVGQAWRGAIELATFGLDRPFIVLHELAHILAGRAYRSRGHCARWRGVLVALVGRFVGRVARTQLVRVYTALGLTTLPPRRGARPNLSKRAGGYKARGQRR